MTYLQKYHSANLPELMKIISKNGIGMDDYLDRFFNNYETTTNYPPYNIVKHDSENFSIELAVAGFTKKDISISKEKERLSIEGKQEEGEEQEYVHKGLASRSFKRTFTLADDIVVKGADMKNGILSVDLERIVPEEDKPQEIKIS